MSAVPHLGFIVAAYAVAAVVIAAMIGAILFDYRDLVARLEKLDTRRSDPQRPPR